MRTDFAKNRQVQQNKTMKKLFLIDAYALIFRFHYAFVHRPFRNPKGENISAVFGFFKFLGELIDREKPDHLGVAFDPKGGNFRHQLFPAYKANRSATPEDIVLAVPYIKEILKARAIPILEVKGYEADDVIGTLAIKASLTGDYDTYMVTPDKDYGQLIRPNVSMYKPAKGGQGVDIVRLEDVCANYCICRPELIIDILALWGDQADNIPGVPGIGEKGACKLVDKWGPVENIIDHAHELPEKQRNAILSGREQLLMSKQLATISLDVPIEFEPEKLVMQQGDDSTLRILYKEQGFNMFLREMDSNNYHSNISSTPGAATKGRAATTPYSRLTADQPSLFDVPGLPSLFDQPSLSDQPLPLSQRPQSTPPASQGQHYADPTLSTANQTQQDENSQSDPQHTDTEHNTDENFATIHTTPHTYQTIDTAQALKALVATLSTHKKLCFDTETTSLEAMNCELVGLSLAVKPFEAFWVPTNSANRAEFLEILKPLLEDDSIDKIGQNIKYDILVLRNYGIKTGGRLLDTMIIHYLLDAESRHSMDYMARALLDYSPVEIESLIGKGARQLTMDRVAPHLVAQYAAEDADVTLRLYEKLWPILEAKELVELYLKIEEPLINCLCDIELRGVSIDPEQLSSSATELNARLVQMEDQIRQVAMDPTLNINSPKQLGELLFEKLDIHHGKIKRTKTGQYRTDEQTLEQISSSHPVVAQILEYRGIKKLVSTYIEALPLLLNPRTGRIHTSFNQAVTATGRLSSTNPNLQNIPIREALGRQIRAAFIAPGGPGDWVLMAADYSQVELRIMAHLSGDENLQAAFLNGEDVHTATAAKIYCVPTQEVTPEQRRRAKMANFGIIYGISTFGLAQRLSIPRDEAKQLIQGYFELYPDVKKYMDQITLQAKEKGYVETIFGRRRYLDQINSSNATMRGLSERNAINAPIQGSAADIIKLAMTNLSRKIEQLALESRITLQVHDELVIEVPRAEIDQMRTLVRESMMGAAELAVPLEVEIGVGHNWLEAH